MKMLSNFEKIFDNIWKKINSFKWEYLFYFVFCIFFLVCSYEIVFFIINFEWYNFTKISVFVYLLFLFFVFIKSFTDNILNDYIKSFVFKNWNKVLLFIFVFYLFLNLVFLKDIFSWFFYYTTFSLFISYVFLRYFWLKTNFNVLENDIKEDDVFSFYTVYIVTFLFILTYLFSFEWLQEHRISLVLVWFIFATFIYFIVFPTKIIADFWVKKIFIYFSSFSILSILIYSYFTFFYNNKSEDILNNSNVKQEVNDNENFQNEQLKQEDFSDDDVLSENQSKSKVEKEYKNIWELYDFSRFIWVWNTWEDVKNLQKIMSTQGFYLWEVNWIFDEETWKSLDNFIETKTWETWNFTQLWPKTLEIFKNIKIPK